MWGMTFYLSKYFTNLRPFNLLKDFVLEPLVLKIDGACS